MINVRVNGYSIVKDNNCAGAQYESSSTKLRLEFSEDWDGFAKTITFWNALGSNPVRIILTINLLENAAKSTRVYIVPIPGEAMTEAGMCPFAIDGFDNVTEEDLKTGGPDVIGVCKRTAEDKFKVLPSRKAQNANNPEILTPDQYNQLQEQIDGIQGIIQNAAISAENAAEYAGTAQTCASVASEGANAATSEAIKAKGSAESAEKYAAYAHEALMKVCYIGDNGNWFIWDSDKGQYEDTNVRAQAGSVVYYGDNPPDEADVWVYPGGEAEYVSKSEFEEMRTELFELANKVAPSPASVTLYADRWEQSEDETMWFQEVVVANATITPNSKVDLQLNAEQVAIFYEKDLAFVTENDGGKVFVYCIGRLPENNYVLQATVSEVVVSE